MSYKTVYYLKETEFIASTEKYVFHFSTQVRANKFLDQREEHLKDLENKLKSQYGISVKLNDYSDFILYSKLEPKGCYIIDIESREVIEWLKDIILDGVIKTNENSNV